MPSRRSRSRSRKTKNQKVLTVYLRVKQLLSDINHRYYSDPKVTIFAPNWVRQGLKYLRKYIKPGTVLRLVAENGSSKDVVLKKQIGLKELQIIARNERSNNSGKIDFRSYEDVITDESVIYSLKDLCRQCVIIGQDVTKHIGGYKTKKVKMVNKVVIIDLIGLQFQKNYNSGRLVLIGNDVPQGLLDDLIYRKVVGQKRPTVNQARQDRTGRFVKKGPLYFDTYAYERFVEKDFYLVCQALHKLPGLKVGIVNLKFLKYGSGFYAGAYSKLVTKHIVNGIYRGLQRQLRQKSNKIKSFEFPFYAHDQRLWELCDKYRIYCGFTDEDALRPADYHMTATTNCACAHAVAGNGMTYGSVDSAIAENLRSKANKFSPIINSKMKEKFIKMYK